MAFERTFQIGWAHLDANGHMANTAFMALAIETRFLYFESRGFTPAEFRQAGIGPVVRRDELEYYKELRFLERVRINVLIGGLSDDASRFRIVNEFRREDGELSARIASHGGWLDIRARKLAAPPAALADALRSLERTPDFETLKSSVSGKQSAGSSTPVG